MSTLLVKCRKCEEDKVQEAFYRNKANVSGYAGVCKVCVRARVSAYNKEHHESHLARAFKHQTHKRYGITPEEYAKCMATSDVCEICGNEEELCYDHDHDTGEFRGVLCRGCNGAIGILGDTKESLKRAYEYLL